MSLKLSPPHVITADYVGEIKTSWQKYNTSSPRGSEYLDELKHQLTRHKLAAQEILGIDCKIIVPVGEILPQGLLDLVDCLGVGIVRV